MSGKKNDLEPKMQHDNDKSRTDNFRDFATKCTSYLGSRFGSIGAKALRVPALNLMLYGYEETYKEEGMDKYEADDAQKWQKIQWTLCNVLNNNFAQSDKTILDKHDLETLTREHADKHDDPSDASFDRDVYNMSKKWLPFASLCFHALREAYVQEDGTEALSAIVQHEAVKHDFGKVGRGTQFHKWRSQYKEAWQTVSNLVDKHEPSYLAGLQLLEVVKRNHHQKTHIFAHNFADKYRTKSFSVDQLLDELGHHFKSADIAHKSNALTNGSGAQVNNTAAGGFKSRKGGKPKRKCRNFNECGKYPNSGWKSFCDDCWKTNKSQETGLTQKEVAHLQSKAHAKRKANFAKKRAKEREANVASAGAESDSDSDDDTPSKKNIPLARVAAASRNEANAAATRKHMYFDDATLEDSASSESESEQEARPKKKRKKEKAPL